MKCYVCGGQMSRTERDIKATWKDRQVVFQGLEAWVCSDCGEQAYDPDTARLMQALLCATEGENTPPEIMNVAEVADLLRVSSQTVYSLARSGKLPSVKVGREWRFMRDDVVAALRGQGAEQTSGAHRQNCVAARGQIGEGFPVSDQETVKPVPEEHAGSK